MSYSALAHRPRQCQALVLRVEEEPRMPRSVAFMSSVRSFSVCSEHSYFTRFNERPNLINCLLGANVQFMLQRRRQIITIMMAADTIFKLKQYKEEGLNCYYEHREVNVLEPVNMKPASIMASIFGLKGRCKHPGTANCLTNEPMCRQSPRDGVAAPQSFHCTEQPACFYSLS
ncbi:hypothetical protein FHG87_016277 [Trinorchestia longiramus]|nr:hypothetical protein FHG87_016277 [Trinorchestia longiramus]